jgi:hypothetical protein
MANKPVTAPAPVKGNTNKPATATAPAAADTVKETKSVVPAKYAGKYKNGGAGPLSDFIREQCGEGDKFEFDAFWNLCKLNGISDDQIAKYKGQVDAKENGANGRARMTLGNSLRAIARKNQKLVGLDKKEHAVPEAALAPSGAAKAQAEKAAAK